MVNSQNFISFNTDLRRLHDIASPLVARIARQLLYDMWEPKGENTIIEHIKDVYSEPWHHWTSSSLPPEPPSTNNAMEAVNGMYKPDGTLRKRS